MVTPNIAVIDYGMGNIRSVSKALELVGAKTIVTDNHKTIESADAVVFPGVGAFGPAIKFLRKSELDKSILSVINQKKPFLGLCLGFQLLFSYSEEDGKHKGLDVIPGKVIRFKNKNIRIPHMGWNNVKVQNKSARSDMFKGIPEKSYFYFVHSYYVVPDSKNDVSALTDYDKSFCSAVNRNNIWGCQFHPEKSSTNGLKLLKNFVNGASKC